MTVYVVQMPTSEKNTDVEHVACMGDRRYAKSIQVGKPEAKRP
jgi:hypothetical protein